MFEDLKITEEEYSPMDLTRLDDTPALSTHDMQAVFDAKPNFLKDRYNRMIDSLDGKIESVLSGSPDKIPTAKAVDDAMGDGGGGDMMKSVYDTNESGIVDTAEDVEAHNILPYPYFDGMGKTENGITFTVLADGTVRANGTTTANTEFRIGRNCTLENGKSYTLLKGVSDSPYMSVLVNAYRNGSYVKTLGRSASGLDHFVCDADDYAINYGIIVNAGITLSNYIFRPMLEEGSHAHVYQPPLGKSISETAFELQKSIGNMVTNLTISAGSTTYEIVNNLFTEDSDYFIFVDDNSLSAFENAHPSYVQENGKLTINFATATESAITIKRIIVVE